jgi:type VI secretion system ImpM family protein
MTAFVAGRAGALGKVPTRAEYLPVPSHAPGFAALDAWLTEATEWAGAWAGPDWSETFAAGAMHGFVFRSASDDADTALCGALAPSRDCAGRLFPVALASPLRVSPQLLTRLELLPFCLEGIWVETTAALADLMDEGAVDGSSVPILKAGPDADVMEAAQLYDDWVSTLPLAELWALLGPAMASPAATLRLLLETLAPTRGKELPTTTLSLRLPLGVAGGAALCFWLDLVRRYVGWRRTLPSLFWSHDGTSGAALLLLGKPPKVALAELWMPSGNREDVADLTYPVGPAAVEAFSPLPPSVVARLGAPESTVVELLSALGA